MASPLTHESNAMYFHHKSLRLWTSLRLPLRSNNSPSRVLRLDCHPSLPCFTLSHLLLHLSRCLLHIPIVQNSLLARWGESSLSLEYTSHVASSTSWPSHRTKSSTRALLPTLIMRRFKISVGSSRITPLSSTRGNVGKAVTLEPILHLS